jgi:hypothetical protein
MYRMSTARQLTDQAIESKHSHSRNESYDSMTQGTGSQPQWMAGWLGSRSSILAQASGDCRSTRPEAYTSAMFSATWYAMNGDLHVAYARRVKTLRAGRRLCGSCSKL